MSIEPGSPIDLSAADQLRQEVEKNPILVEATKEAMEKQALIEPTIRAVLDLITNRAKDKEDKFEFEHGFIVLGRCLNFLAQGLCISKENFEEELLAAHNIAIKEVIPMLWPVNEEGEPIGNPANYNLARLMLIAGSFVDHIFWRDTLGRQYEAYNTIATPDVAPSEEPTT